MIDSGTTDARVDQVVAMPVVGILAADARQIRALCASEPHWNGWSYMLSAARL